MKYNLRDYQGKEFSLTQEQASKIAAAAELLELVVNGQTHYLNPKNIAGISPSQGTANDDLSYRRPFLRGRVSDDKLPSGQ